MMQIAIGLTYFKLLSHSQILFKHLHNIDYYLVHRIIKCRKESAYHYTKKNYRIEAIKKGQNQKIVATRYGELLQLLFVSL